MPLHGIVAHRGEGQVGGHAHHYKGGLPPIDEYRALLRAQLEEIDAVGLIEFANVMTAHVHDPSTDRESVAVAEAVVRAELDRRYGVPRSRRERMES